MVEMKSYWPYPIGTPGVAWSPEEKQQWLLRADKPVRTYQEEVLVKLETLKEKFDVTQYGALNYLDAQKFPLFAVRSRNWDNAKPNVLVTGGVHGYETSGVQGAILFMQTKMEHYSQYFNIIIAPCVSPWGYERIQRWNGKALDPNRCFFRESGCEEANAILDLIESLANINFLAHWDLHETTDSDASEFTPAKAARDGEEYEECIIPDGFYIIDTLEHQQPEWHTAMIKAVSAVTHIAPPDSNGLIIGKPMLQEGVIATDPRVIRSCKLATNAKYKTTTEVYPDSPKTNPEQCNLAQVACLSSGLDYLITNELGK